MGEGEGTQSFNPSHFFFNHSRSQSFKLKDQIIWDLYNLGIFPDMLLKRYLTYTKLVSNMQHLCPCAIEWTLLTGIAYHQS